MKTKVNGYVEEKQAKKQTNTYTHTHKQRIKKKKERLTAGKRVSSFFLILSKLGTLRKREEKIQKLSISLCLCLSVSSGFVCTFTNRNSQEKKKKTKQRTKTKTVQHLKGTTKETKIFCIFVEIRFGLFQTAVFRQKGATKLSNISHI